MIGRRQRLITKALNWLNMTERSKHRSNRYSSIKRGPNWLNKSWIMLLRGVPRNIRMRKRRSWQSIVLSRQSRTKENMRRRRWIPDYRRMSHIRKGSWTRRQVRTNSRDMMRSKLRVTWKEEMHICIILSRSSGSEKIAFGICQRKGIFMKHNISCCENTTRSR